MISRDQRRNTTKNAAAMRRLSSPLQMPLNDAHRSNTAAYIVAEHHYHFFVECKEEIPPIAVPRML